MILFSPLQIIKYNNYDTFSTVDEGHYSTASSLLSGTCQILLDDESRAEMSPDMPESDWSHDYLEVGKPSRSSKLLATTSQKGGRSLAQLLKACQTEERVESVAASYHLGCDVS